MMSRKGLFLGEYWLWRLFEIREGNLSSRCKPAPRKNASGVAEHRIGQVATYSTGREILAEMSTYYDASVSVSADVGLQRDGYYYPAYS